MKKLRKLLSVAVAALAAASLAVTTVVSYADDLYDEEASVTHSLTIENTTPGHIYEAYQIFKGSRDGDVLSNIEWGTGVNSTELLVALKTFDSANFTDDIDTAAEVADIIAKKYSGDTADKIIEVIGAHLDAVTGSATVAEGAVSATIENLSNGYYLVKDKDGSLNEKDEAYTKFIAKIVKNTTATPKSSKPSVEKKLKDDDDDVTEKWQDVADYNIGDSVPFQLTGTMPSTLSDYDTYKYVFHDSLSLGLTRNDDVKVYLVNEGQERVDITSSFTTSIVDTSGNFTVSCDDVTEIEGVTAKSKIVVEYSAKLNTEAVIGLEGNPNEVYLEYSNNPSQEGKGETGNTPKDQVVVFTYELDVTKVDGEDTGKKLEGAEFKLQNAEGKWLKIDAANKVEAWVDTEDDASTLKTDASGLIMVIGLDEGTYTLTETKAPHGYNKLSGNITLTIAAEDKHDVDYNGKNAADELTALTLKVDDGDPANGTVANGLVSTTVKNNKGSVLPETGGIGTTIFFVGGGIVVAGAAILLIVKRRMRSDS